jgi:hypothetical protein
MEDITNSIGLIILPTFLEIYNVKGDTALHKYPHIKILYSSYICVEIFKYVWVS